MSRREMFAWSVLAGLTLMAISVTAQLAVLAIVAVVGMVTR